MAFTFFMGFKFTKEFRYQQKILVGLFFSSIGDAFLDYNEGELFPFGMLAFAVAQISYISAFRWKPFRPFLGLILFVLGGFGELPCSSLFRFFNLSILFSAMSVMFKNFEGILLFGVPIYSALLLSMCWRANARIQITNLPKILAAIGGVCFVASDSLIAFDMFYSPIEHSKIWVMSTYYIAQMGITLSILDHEVMTTNESAKSK